MNLRPLYNKVVHSVRIFADVIACHIVHFVLIFEHALSPCRIVHFACIFAGAYPSTH